MRWPGVDIPGQTCGGQPGCGEQDLCEGHSLTGCTSFIHYGHPRNHFISHRYRVDLTQWHTWQFTQLNHTLTTTVDGNVAWACNASTVPACNSTTVMPTLKRVVLQQECANTTSPCPPKSSGKEQIQVDWIVVERRT